MTMNPSVTTKESTAIKIIRRVPAEGFTAGTGGKVGAVGKVTEGAATGSAAAENGGHSETGGAGLPWGGGAAALPRPPSIIVKSLGPLATGIDGTSCAVGARGGEGAWKNSVAPPSGSTVGAEGRLGGGGGSNREGGGNGSAASGARKKSVNSLAPRSAVLWDAGGGAEGGAGRAGGCGTSKNCVNSPASPVRGGGGEAAGGAYGIGAGGACGRGAGGAPPPGWLKN